ncbi:hypothetical protein [Thiomicrorhabdus sp. 6S3-12]|uniref:hypothetical protein n=1 Tax=Thiomicrorhabdus sp. 6S3-12 TaxID=2819681 RepID=UPI001AAC4C14|nr:hypothetical protein [Thiomicrorhabdus sp. 6S3-12]MBO1924932.1 hypothetical protein [Thiomicrorhabdus sp. 6S3-12]
MFSQSANADSISQSDYTSIGQKIYQNECAGKPEYLLFWSEKEAFPSLGIGHFIWFPKGVDAPFEQTFPEFLRYVQRNSSSTKLPVGNAGFSNAPWKNREVFYALKELGKLADWQAFLQDTFALQAAFIVQRFQSKLPELLAQVPSNRRDEIQSKIDVLLASEKGMFALVDYSNFKGLGTNSKERYQGKGWGLVQVLLAMKLPEHLSETAVLNAFVRATKQTLQQRTQLAPNPKLEASWLPGWFKRLDAYL